MSRLIAIHLDDAGIAPPTPDEYKVHTENGRASQNIELAVRD